jgi:hypothetical protein
MVETGCMIPLCAAAGETGQGVFGVSRFGRQQGPICNGSITWSSLALLLRRTVLTGCQQLLQAGVLSVLQCAFSAAAEPVHTGQPLLIAEKAISECYL